MRELKKNRLRAQSVVSLSFKFYMEIHGLHLQDKCCSQPPTPLLHEDIAHAYLLTVESCFVERIDRHVVGAFCVFVVRINFKIN